MLCQKDKDDQFAKIITSAVKVVEAENKKTFYNKKGDAVLVVKSIN